MVFFLICIGYFAKLWDDLFYAEEALRVYARYANGWEDLGI